MIITDKLNIKNIGSDVIMGHKGYYIDSINTKEKWMILSDSETKPEYPEIGDDVTDKSLMNAPYAGVYQVTSDKDVTVTNETGHTVTLTAGETSFFYLIKGDNNITMSDSSAKLTFTAIANNGMNHLADVEAGDFKIVQNHVYYDKATLVPANGSAEITVTLTESGMYYLSPQINADATNLAIQIETDTGLYGAPTHDRYGWCHYDGDGLVQYAYLRAGTNTVKLVNNNNSAMTIDQVRFSKTSNYVVGLTWENVKVIPYELPGELTPTDAPVPTDAPDTITYLDMVKTNFPKDNSFQYKLDNYDLGYSVGDEFSMVNGAHYDFCGTITNIEGKKVYYEEDLPFNKVDKTTNDFDDHIFFVPSKPDVGVVNIVTIAFATGVNTKAAGKASFGAGRDNVAGGDYSFVAGRNNLASYCAAALGLNTQAKGRYTFSAGYFAKALGEYSAAINNYTTAKGENSFAHGYGTLATGDSMVAGGKWNLTGDGVIVVYGNGDSWDKRRDAYTLDWNGVGWYAGGLKIGGSGQDDAEDVLVRSQVLELIRQNSNNVDLSNYYTRSQVESLIDTKISNAITSLIGGSY